jgi:hypothetical protein
MKWKLLIASEGNATTLAKTPEENVMPLRASE